MGFHEISKSDVGRAIGAYPGGMNSFAAFLYDDKNVRILYENGSTLKSMTAKVSYVMLAIVIEPHVPLLPPLPHPACNFAVYSFHRDIDTPSTCTTPAPHISSPLLYAASLGGYHKLVHVPSLQSKAELLTM